MPLDAISTPVRLMKAVAIGGLGQPDPQTLFDTTLPVPEPGPLDLRVRVEAVSVNPVDWKVRRRQTSRDATPKVLGYDAAGVVDAVGAEVRGFAVGDRVYYAGSIVRQGSNAQFHCVDHRIVGHMPRSLDFAQAAALPLTAITAWELLFDRFRIDPYGRDAAKTIVVIGAAGGVGSMLVQLARWAGLVVIGTASRPASREYLRDLGAAAVLDHGKPLPEQLEALGYTDGADYVANLVDTDAYWETCARLVKTQGMIGLIVGSKQPQNVEIMKDRSISVVWEMMFTRSEYGTPDIAEQGRLLATLARLIDAGVIRTSLAETVSPINAAQLDSAHARSAAGRHEGGTIDRPASGAV
jgi:zinc-binding alcohol dehydrogenase family protein